MTQQRYHISTYSCMKRDIYHRHILPHENLWKFCPVRNRVFRRWISILQILWTTAFAGKKPKVKILTIKPNGVANHRMSAFTCRILVFIEIEQSKFWDKCMFLWFSQSHAPRKQWTHFTTFLPSCYSELLYVRESNSKENPHASDGRF